MPATTLSKSLSADSELQMGVVWVKVAERGRRKSQRAKTIRAKVAEERVGLTRRLRRKRSDRRTVAARAQLERTPLALLRPPRSIRAWMLKDWKPLHSH
jgi:hypothetical protein